MTDSLAFERRVLLKSAALAAAASFVGGGSNAFADDSKPLVDPVADLTWDKAPCRFCGTGCHVKVGVSEGKIRAIAGDPDAEVNKGLLCVKGYHVGLALYGADRLRLPQSRRGGKLVDISWDEALDILADRVMAAPDRFAFYGSGQWTIPEGYAANKLMKGGLANNHIDPNARLCMSSAVTGFISTYGVDEPAGCYDDLDRCDVLIMWGNNPAEMHPVLFSRVVDRRSRGEEILLVDIGTRRTRTTEHCQEYLEFAPGSDLAIANGIAHLLLKNETWDRGFVEKHCNFRADTPEPTLLGRPSDLEEYRALLEPYTPEYVERVSGVPAAKIHMLAGLFGRRDLRVTSLWCMG